MVIAFSASDECYKFASEMQTINGFLFIRGHNIIFRNECNELDTLISKAKPFHDNYNLFGSNGGELFSFSLTEKQCAEFGMVEY